MAFAAGSLTRRFTRFWLDGRVDRDTFFRLTGERWATHLERRAEMQRIVDREEAIDATEAALEEMPEFDGIFGV